MIYSKKVIRKMNKYIKDKRKKSCRQKNGVSNSKKPKTKLKKKDQADPRDLCLLRHLRLLHAGASSELVAAVRALPGLVAMSTFVFV